jgi:hypothetical protein
LALARIEIYNWLTYFPFGTVSPKPRATINITKSLLQENSFLKLLVALPEPRCYVPNLKSINPLHILQMLEKKEQS